MLGTNEGGSAPRSLTGVVILVVEDEFLVALNAETTLRQLGCTVLGPVGSRMEATRLVEQTRPDLVLLDLNLRDGPATELARALRDAAIPFLLTTGYAELPENDVLRAAPRLDKPYSDDTLIVSLRRLLAT